MKENDILVCKKYFCFITYSGDIIEYEPNKHYKISMILYHKKWYNPGKHKTHIDQSYNWIKFDGIKGNYGFSDRKVLQKDKKRWLYDRDYVWDYFYKLKDWRKLKLEKIEKSED